MSHTLSEASSLELLDVLLKKLDDEAALRTERARLGLDAFDDLVSKTSTLAARLHTLALSTPSFPASIHRLPPELLGRIFTLLASSPPSFPHAFAGRRGRYAWVRAVVPVCRRWRAVAYAHAALWATLDTAHGPAAVSTLLARARDAPMSVLVDGHASREALASLQGTSGQLREAQLQLLEPGHMRAALSALAGPAPHLHTLALSFSARTETTHASDLPPLFGGHAPSLERLHISRPPAWPLWPGHAFGGLKVLALVRQHVARPALVDFLDFLAQSPLLEELTLDEAGPAHILEPAVLSPPPETRLALPHLRALTISDRHSSGPAQLLASLSIPASTTLTVSVESGEVTLARLFPHGAAHLSPLHSARALRIELFTSPGSAYAWAKLSGPGFELRLTDLRGGASRLVEDALRALPRVFHMSRVRALRLTGHGAPVVGAPVWRAVFAEMEGVRTLEMCGAQKAPYPASVGDALLRLGSAGAPMPGLERLVMRGWTEGVLRRMAVIRKQRPGLVVEHVEEGL